MSAQKRSVRDVALRGVGVKVEGGVCVCVDFGMALSAPQTHPLRKHRGCWAFRILSSKQGPSGPSVSALWSRVLPFTATSLPLITLNP